MKPVIGITTFFETRLIKTYCTVSLNYVNAVCAAGGIPIMLPLIRGETITSDYLEPLDGLILTGGEDVCPLRYGENPIKEVDLFCPDRDEFEINLFKKALEKDLPVLGVCRGLHVMNTTLGGTLYQDLFCQVENSLGHMPKKLPVDNLYHSIQIKQGSQLEKIFGSNEIKVNSYHHQSAKKVADDFEISAWADDNIIEAIEHKFKEFVVGIQWHPEDLVIKHPTFLKLFEALVNASMTSKENQKKHPQWNSNTTVYKAMA